MPRNWRHSRSKRQREGQEEPRKPMGFITVSIGEGLNAIFKELGADYIIEGGQTMNPSTEDMLKAIDAGECRYCIYPCRTIRILSLQQIRQRRLWRIRRSL